MDIHGSEALFFLSSEPVLAVVLFALLALAGELGFRLGRRAAPGMSADDRSQATAVEAAVLGLVGLLLAFTFGAASARFDAIRDGIGEEGAALGRAWRTAGSLDEPQRGELRACIVDYLDVRLDITRAAEAGDLACFQGDLDRSERLATRAGEIATEVLRQAPHEERSARLVEAVDAVHSTRAKLLQDARGRLPGAVLLLLAGSTAAAILMVGYAKGVSGRRAPLESVILAVLTVTIVLLIVDLDRPMRGMIRVPQQNLVELHERLVGAP
jgi:hypothetical protein